MKNRILIAGVVAAVALGGGLAAMPAPVSARPAAVRTVATAAHASPASSSTITHKRRVRYNMLFPGLTHFFAKPQTPPLNPLLRFYMLEHTNSYPRKWNAVFCLHKWRFSVRERRWVPTRQFPCAHLSVADLAAPGDTVTWHLGDQPYPYWYCKRGRYFVSWSGHAVSSTGIHQHYLQYSPFRPGSRIPGEDWGRGIPTRSESHRQKNCNKP